MLDSNFGMMYLKFWGCRLLTLWFRRIVHLSEIIIPVLQKKPEVKTEEEGKAEENNEPKSIVEILIEFGLDSTIQGLNYIFYPSQASTRMILYQKVLARAVTDTVTEW